MSRDFEKNIFVASPYARFLLLLVSSFDFDIRTRAWTI